MAVNKFVVGDEVKLDLTTDTVSENNLLLGATAHNSAGEPITGAMVTVPVDSELSVTSENAIQNKAVANALNDKAAASHTHWINRDMDILTNATYEMPYETYINDIDAVNLGVVPQNNGSYWHIHYFRALPSMGYGLQIAMPLNLAAGMPVYRKSEGTTWGSWCKFADGGNADTLDGKHASDFAAAATATSLQEQINTLKAAILSLGGNV